MAQTVAFKHAERSALFATIEARRGRPRIQDRALVPSNPVIAAVLAAIHAAGPFARQKQFGWHEDTDAIPVFVHSGRSRGKITVSPRISRGSGDSDDPPDPDALWRLITTLSPRTADVALAVLAELCRPNDAPAANAPLLESRLITAERLLSYAARPARAADLDAMHDGVREEMRRLQFLSFKVEGYPTFDPVSGRWMTRDTTWSGDRLFDIVELQMPGSDQPSWLVRAGQWAYWWLNPDGRYWVGGMSAALLALNHRADSDQQAIAKRLGQRLTILSIALQGAPVIVRRIDRLLADIGELPRPELRRGHWAQRTRQRFEHAMAMLQQLGILNQVTWLDGHGPDERPTGRWVNHWLEARISISMGTAIHEGDIDAPSERGDDHAVH